MIGLCIQSQAKEARKTQEPLWEFLKIVLSPTVERKTVLSGLGLFTQVGELQRHLVSLYRYVTKSWPLFVKVWETKSSEGTFQWMSL